MSLDNTNRRSFLKSTTAALVFSSGLARSGNAAELPPTLGVADWQRNMVTYGTRHGKFLAAGRLTDPLDPLLGATFYDAQRVFYQIADYTKNNSWNSYALAAMSVYRDRYVLPNNGAIPGYWLFSQGLAMNFERTGDPISHEAIRLMAKNGAYVRDSTPVQTTVSPVLSRETAYAIMTKLDSEAVGEPRSPYLTTLVDHSLGHIDAWCLSRTAPGVMPFMVGLTAEALIRWEAKENDPRVLPAIKTAAIWLWNNLWLPKYQAFAYVEPLYNSDVPYPAYDLSLLIAPLYAWLYHQTGELPYRDCAVATFATGVKKAYIAGPKQFNQNYRWSFDYLKWVTARPLVKRLFNSGRR